MKFTDAVRLTWAPVGGAAAGKQDKKPAAIIPVETKVAEEKPKDDDMDLFGDDDEEDSVGLLFNRKIHNPNIYMFIGSC